MLLQSLLVALTGAQIVLIGVFTSLRDWGLAAAVVPLPFVSQLVALAYRIGYHDLLDGVPLNVAVKVDRSAGGVDDDTAYAPPGAPGATNPLPQHVARLSDAGSRPPTPDRARRRGSEDPPERDDSPGATDGADDAAGAPVDKQAKCKARRQRQRERAKAKQKERKAGPAGQAPTLFVRAFNGELDRRELTKLAEASLGGGVVTKVRAVGEDGGTTSVYIELKEGTLVREAAQKLHKKQLANGAQLSVKAALDKAGLEDVVRKKGKRKEPEAMAASARRPRAARRPRR